MARIKKIALAALVALALAAGGVAVSDAPQTQLAWSLGSSNTTSFIDDEEIIEQVAGSAGGRSSAGRESASLPAIPGESQIASSAGGRSSAGRESS